MDVSFEGEAYPTRDERAVFGYRPDAIYVLSGAEDDFEDSQSFRGGSAEDVLEGFEDGFLGFEYINKDVSEGNDSSPVPRYQREIVPVEFLPTDDWVSMLESIEDMNESVADTFFSATVHDNSGYFRRIENFTENLSEPTITTAPDIQGLRAVSYAPERKEADIIQYRTEVEVPEEPTEHPPGSMISDVDYEKVEVPRDEERIQELVETHEGWEIDKITLPFYEVPPELRPSNEN